MEKGACQVIANSVVNPLPNHYAGEESRLESLLRTAAEQLLCMNSIVLTAEVGTNESFVLCAQKWASQCGVEIAPA